MPLKRYVRGPVRPEVFRDEGEINCRAVSQAQLRIWCRSLVLTVCWWLVTLGASAHAQTVGDTIVTRRVRGADALRVATDLEVPPTSTVATAHFEITNPKRPSPRDRNMVIRFYYQPWANNQKSTLYRIPVRLAEGQKSVKVDLSFINPAVQSVWDVTVYENGRDIEDKTQRPTNVSPFQWTYHQNIDEAFGGLHAPDENVSAMDSTLQWLTPKVQLTTTAARGTPAVTPYLRNENAAEASTDWRAYFGYQAWVVSAKALRYITERQPEVASALQAYVAAGGTLFVHSAGEASDLELLDGFLGIDESNAPHRKTWVSEKNPKLEWWWQGASTIDSQQASQESQTEEGSLTSRGAGFDAVLAADTWVQAAMGSHADNLRQLHYLLGDDESDYWFTDEQFNFSGYRNRLLDVLDDEQLMRREYVSGTILLSSKPVTDVNRQLVVDTISKLGVKRDASYTSSESDGDWFWRNLITTVGKPPVWTFCVIVALFGALLGPGLLFLTGKIQRRSLMIFMVPAIAFLAVMAIVAYGVLHEGFDTYTRVTSLTRIDTTADVGFAWSRQNYFSGQPPREGVSINAHTYVRPVVSESSRWYRNGNPRYGIGHTVTILPNKQVWSGWLKPRQQQQLMIGHPIESPASPVSLMRADGGLTITNVSSDEIPFVVVRGEDDDYYFCETLRPGESTTVGRLSQVDAESDVAKKMVDYKPAPPPELKAGGSLWAWSNNDRRALRGMESQDVFNRAIEDYLSDRLKMEPYSFATLVGRNPAVEVPVQQTDDSQVSEELHIVIGVHPW